MFTFMTKAIFVSTTAILLVVVCFRFFAAGDPVSYARPHTAVLLADSAIDWENMDHATRKDYMHDVVVPRMREVFRGFDSVEFAELKCGVCHGAGVKDQSFKMPNPKLLKLPSTQEGWKRLSDKKGNWMKFMSTQVKPEMAKLLGMQPFDPKTGKGFGCSNCHTSE